MENKDNIIEVYDKDNNKIEMRVIFIGNSEKYSKDYIFYFDPKANDGQVYASVYAEDDTLKDVPDNEWDEVNDMFNQYMEDLQSKKGKGGCGGCSGCQGNSCDSEECGNSCPGCEKE